MKIKKKFEGITFLGLPSSDQKKIIKAAAKSANNDQRDLVMEYEKSCCNLGSACGCK